MSGADYRDPKLALRELKAAYPKVLDGHKVRLALPLNDGTHRVFCFGPSQKNDLRIEIRRLEAEWG